MLASKLVGLTGDQLAVRVVASDSPVDVAVLRRLIPRSGTVRLYCSLETALHLGSVLASRVTVAGRRVHWCPNDDPGFRLEYNCVPEIDVHELIFAEQAG